MKKDSPSIIIKKNRVSATNLIVIITLLLFLISLAPIIYVGLFNYPTGDDYWYGALTYRALMETGSLWEALKGSLRTVINFYYDWQGTWFTIFLFTLSPNNFIEGGYVLTIFIALLSLIGSMVLLADYYLVKKLEFNKAAVAIIVCTLLYLFLQYMPRTTSGLYWFNGVMHYSIPFLLAVLAVVNSHKYMEEKKKINLLVSSLCFLLLGGGSYLAPLAATLTVILIWISKIDFSYNKNDKKIKINIDKRNILIFGGIVLETIGLIISFLSPGNSVRGGDEFGFSIKWILQCIYYAIDRGIYLGIDYFTENWIILFVYLTLAVLVWQQLWTKTKKKYSFKFPLLFILFTNGIYWAIYTPEIYSRSDVSGGVQNTYYQVFLIVTLANIIYGHGWIQNRIKKREKHACNKILPNNLICTGLVGIMLLILINIPSTVVTTNEYCLDYINSGKLKKYAEIRRKQHEILIDDSIIEATIPEMKGTYPILNMNLENDPNYAHNINKAKYYGKKLITAYMVE